MKGMCVVCDSASAEVLKVPIFDAASRGFVQEVVCSDCVEGQGTEAEVTEDEWDL